MIFEIHGASGASISLRSPCRRDRDNMSRRSISIFINVIRTDSSSEHARRAVHYRISPARIGTIQHPSDSIKASIREGNAHAEYFGAPRSRDFVSRESLPAPVSIPFRNLLNLTGVRKLCLRAAHAVQDVSRVKYESYQKPISSAYVI